jgi:hypothetical protein
MIVFLEPEMLVTDQWLSPLVHTLTKYKNALVYPVQNVLTISDDSVYEVIKSADVVAAFDWSMQLTWESVLPPSEGTERVKNIPGELEKSQEENFSPAVPKVFAVRLSYFLEIGVFDPSLNTVSYESTDTTELSIRNWLCGGVILRQSCSQIAVHLPNTFAEVPKGVGITQKSIDVSVMTIANKWLDSQHTSSIGNSNAHIDYKELVFQARFTNRVPYAVETSVDPGSLIVICLCVLYFVCALC